MAVARKRLEGIEDHPSPDKSRAESSTMPRFAFDLQSPVSLICCCSDLVRTEKQKLLAATTIEAPTPTIFQGFENSYLQLPVAQAQPWSVAASAHAFATGAVGVALPAPAPTVRQAAIPRALGRLPDEGWRMAR